MTTFLTFALYSVRISSEFPKSDTVPLITIYFVLSILFPFLSLVWFAIKDDLIKESQSLPLCLTKFSHALKKSIFFCFFTTTSKDDDESKVSKAKLIEKCKKCDLCTKCNSEIDKEKKKKNTKSELEENLDAITYFLFACLFIIILATDLTLWLLIFI